LFQEGSVFPHNHARWAEAFIIVYSITELESLTEVREILSRIRRIKGPKYVPILILGNKKDLEHARQVSNQDRFDAFNI
jgi:GTPase SAR1 family protein